MSRPLDGKTIALTGATAGIGRAAALELAGRGARMLLVCRDRAKGEAVVGTIRAAGGAAELVLADLSLLSEVRRAGAELLALAPRLDVLVNNAGALFQRRELTAEGHELTFATNHLSYFLLTRLLLERLKAGAPARVVNVASAAHRRAKTEAFDDLRAERCYDGWQRYGLSKLANILFTRELARRLEGTGVTANSLHPGVVATGFGLNTTGLLKLLIKAAQPFELTPEQGADTVVWLAASPEAAGVTGKYFARRVEARSTAAAQDDDAARRLWTLSEGLCGL
ncbi:MAG: SDR family oxidoreductase [Elusimicrobia bacterium]|nr:SDR family oxidoreductase [Elusimicrobiota bacterium]